MMDVGTDNPPSSMILYYISWRHPRINRKAYDHFVDMVVKSIQRKFPDVFLQWEDFGKEKARCNLDRYQDKICTFNDDYRVLEL